jgi:flagellar motor switch protein FliG
MNSTTQPTSKAGIRKAAIFVASLDRAAADAVLEHLGPMQAQLVRQAVVALDSIPADEQDDVIEEFYELETRRTGPMPEGIELGGRLAREIASPRSSMNTEREAFSPSSPPFVRLRDAEGEKLARLLAAERPQTIALVLSHLPPRQAGCLLARLQPRLQVEVIQRFVDLEETDPIILREVEQSLEARLSQQVRMQRKRVAGLEAVNGILESTDGEVRLQIIKNLSAGDRDLAERLIPPAMEFDDLLELDDDVLAEVFRAVEPQWIMPALLGALPEISHRVLRLLPRHQAESIRYKLEQPGPIRLSDMETARQRIAQTARNIVFAKRGKSYAA